MPALKPLTLAIGLHERPRARVVLGEAERRHLDAVIDLGDHEGLLGLALAERGGRPQAILFAAAQDLGHGVLTVLGDGADATLAAVHEAMASSSLFTGQVVELHLDLDDMHDMHGMRSSLTLLPRPEVTTEKSL